MSEFFVGRQPIVNGREQTVAHELLFRTDPALGPTPVDGDVATARVIAGIYGSSGLASLAGGKRLFINATRHTLTSGLFRMLPPSAIVVEVLEDVVVDEQLLREVVALKRDGYRIALDDWTEDHRQRALLPLADIVKVEISAFSHRELSEAAEMLKRRGLVLLAEKVETREQHAACAALGFRLFQGHLYARPRLIRHRQVNPLRSTALRMLASLQDADMGLAQVATLISEDPGFAIRVLRLCNSALLAGSRTFADIPAAVTHLGVRRLQQLATLVTFSGVGADAEDGELLRLALTRARACELLAPKLGADSAAAFLVGLLSMAERMVGLDVTTLVSELTLAEPSVRALSGDGSFPLGACLARVLAFEAPVEKQDEGLAETRRFSLAYIEAMRWANEVLAGSLGAAASESA